MTNLTYQKYDTQFTQLNTRAGLCKNWVQLVNASYCMPAFKFDLLQNAAKNDISGKREIHENSNTQKWDRLSLNTKQASLQGNEFNIIL